MNVFERAFAFARPSNWFLSKMPPLLAVAYICTLCLQVSALETFRLLTVGFSSIVFIAIYGHVVNDIFDEEADRLANKSNPLAGMSRVSQALLAGGFLIAGFLPIYAVGAPTPVWTLLVLNYLWPTIYSMPFPRLKEHGLLGVACDVLGSHVTPTLLVIALFATVAPSALPDSITVAAAAAVVWSSALGLKGILHHQIADRENDKRAGIVTFSTVRDVARLQRFLTGFNLFIELPVSILFAAAVLQWCALVPFALMLYVASETIKYKLGFQFALTADPATVRASVPFTNEMFYVLWMPAASVVQLGLDQPVLLGLPVLHFLIFRQIVVRQATDWHAIFDNLTLRYRGRRA